VKIRFWVCVGESGRVYDITWTMTGGPPTRRPFTYNDEFKWKELFLAV